ncbi:MAG: dicarboxylate/amino acid:cation symporter [Bacteroidota bacterium]
MRKIPVHIQIMVGLALGLFYAILSIRLGLPASFTVHYIKPFGTIFLNSLKLVAIPLIFASLVVGVSSIGDVTKLSRIGSKTFLIYTATTVLAVVIGLCIANLLQPGTVISPQTRDRLTSLYAGQAEQQRVTLEQIQEVAPLQVLVNLVPENLVATMSSNLNLLQVVLIAIFFGVALLRIPPRKSKPVILFFEGLNEAITEVIRFIMRLAPLGVFALVSSLLIEVAGDNADDIFDVLYALLWYVVTVSFGLMLMTFVVYPILIKLLTKISYVDFFKGIRPAQIVAFTTSSSSAALPVTMERVEKHLGVSEEVSSFVLPLGATVNMDGTALYQGIAVVFIAQALGLDLSIAAQLTIVANVAASSIGVAGVPGAAIVTTAMILQTIGIPASGLALILAPDRILDMCRTATNVTGDAAVAVIVASSEGELAEEDNDKLLENDDY